MNKKGMILFLGDVVPYKPLRFKNKFKTVINLECPVTHQGTPAKDKIVLRVQENYLENIFGSNLLCASLGNNHMLDFGREGLEATITNLEGMDVKWFGISDDTSGEFQPLIVRFNENKIAFIAVVCASTSPLTETENVKRLDLLDQEKISRQIQSVRDSVTRVIVYIHWGIEESSYPSRQDVMTARSLIEAGADLVIGSHAHAPQSVERYKGGIIAYNLGNFIMPGMKGLPAYFNEAGDARSTYTKRTMIWNRISWGLLVSMDTLEFRINKYLQLPNRIVGLLFTPLDKYIKIRENPFDAHYESLIDRHLNKRKFYRKIADFIYHPHVPKTLKGKLWS